MQKGLFLLFIVLFKVSNIQGQKKPLDHTVYDHWQSIGERMISPDGKWVVYTIDPQEGDNELVIQSTEASYKKTIQRGYSAVLTEDSRFVVFKIKPLYQDTREARIKKRKAEDFPKDSIGIVELGKNDIWKKARIRSYKTPQKGAGWVAYLLEKPVESQSKTKSQETFSINRVDSLNRVIDSLQRVLESMPKKKKKKNKNGDEVELGVESRYLSGGEFDDDIIYAEGDESSADAGSELVLRNLLTGEEKSFSNILDYYFSKNGGKLLLKKARNPKDSLSKLSVLLHNTATSVTFALARGGNDFRNFAFSEDGSQLAYLAERDTVKNQPRLYRLWHYKDGMDSAVLLADKYSAGMKIGLTISEFGTVSFSKSGNRLFFGTAPVQPLKDTSIVEIDKPKLDIWHYNEDYLQTVQTFPNRLRNDLQQNFLAVYDLENKTIQQLGSREIPLVLQTNEGDGDVFVGVTDVGKRIEIQWTGTPLRDIYAINVRTGEKKLVKENLFGQVYPSSTGRYILWYDRRAKNYFAWDGKTTRNLTQSIRVPLWNEDSQLPEDANPYGVMGWHEKDSAVYVYDKYDVWRVFLDQAKTEILYKEKQHRKNKIALRYIRLDPEETFISENQRILFRVFDDKQKTFNLWLTRLKDSDDLSRVTVSPFYSCKCNYSNISRAKNIEHFIYTKENFQDPPNLYVNRGQNIIRKTEAGMISQNDERQLSSINVQQTQYLWGIAELFKWKAYNGKEATGIVYKPENFDPKKKYPMICYFYEKLSQNLHNYYAPAPIRSAINIPFFVSQGYVIFLPDIHYTVGQPGKDAYNYVVSGARALVKKGFIDSTRIGIQGHSWGGYQVLALITYTKLFKAAWAGAPVVNMTSAYGGIRWESGVSRQFQYERSQSRIGASLWEKPQLYIQNSPLFKLDKVTTPLVIMANDSDGAVPWYQGIELFTALRRLGKKVWMFNYNGQGHGLTQRQDMRDYHIRMQQFFDWQLKNERPAKWITEGVPAVRKGKDWGLEID